MPAALVESNFVFDLRTIRTLTAGLHKEPKIRPGKHPSAFGCKAKAGIGHGFGRHGK